MYVIYCLALLRLTEFAAEWPRSSRRLLWRVIVFDCLLQDYFVEVDVVMDASTPLWKAHDISQQLQDKIEVLPNVERAFVHVDHETTHVPVSALFYFS
jgi:Dimerisation domain of Zinc Transporter